MAKKRARATTGTQRAEVVPEKIRVAARVIEAEKVPPLVIHVVVRDVEARPAFTISAPVRDAKKPDQVEEAPRGDPPLAC